MQTHTYKNGFRLVYQHLNNPETSIQMYCDFGSIHEPANCRGAAHFIEHMCFKGTHRLRNTSELSTVFDKSGAHLNAFTDRRTTCYYASGTVTDFAEKIDTICDMMLNSVFDPVEYQKEHNVVREEMYKDADDAELAAIENADKHLFAGTNYALPVDALEYHTGKGALPRSNVYAVYKNNYIPANFILSICTSLRWTEVKRVVDRCLIAKASADQKTSADQKASVFNRRAALPIALAPIVKPIVVTKHQPGLSTSHLCIGYRTCARLHPDMPKLIFASAALSSTMNARMFFVLREKYGLSYTSSCQTDFFDVCGAIRFCVECDTNKFNKTYAVLKTLIADLAKDGLTSQEFNLTRGYLQGQMTLKMQDPGNISSHNGEQLLYNDVECINYTEYFNRFIAPLTLRDINNCLATYLTTNLNVTSVVSSDKNVLRSLCK